MPQPACLSISRVLYFRKKIYFFSTKIVGGHKYWYSDIIYFIVFFFVFSIAWRVQFHIRIIWKTLKCLKKLKATPWSVKDTNIDILKLSPSESFQCLILAFSYRRQEPWGSVSYYESSMNNVSNVYFSVWENLRCHIIWGALKNATWITNIYNRKKSVVCNIIVISVYSMMSFLWFFGRLFLCN